MSMVEDAQPKCVAVAKRKLRWWQFSLTALFVMVTALGVTMGIMGQRVAVQRRAVAAIEALGGRASYAELDAPTSVRSKMRWLPGDWTQTIVLVDLSGRQVSDHDLKPLHALAGLESLHLQRTQVTDAGRAGLRTALPDCRIHD